MLYHIGYPYFLLNDLKSSNQKDETKKKKKYFTLKYLYTLLIRSLLEYASLI